MTEKSSVAAEGYDVFLCYNSAERGAVKPIADHLKGLGLRPWLDQWELRPGFPWQRGLEEQIANIRSAAVFVGANNIGPWQDLEVDAFLREFVRRRCPVIPVILPSCHEPPKLPLFLEGMTWVDFRHEDPDPMWQLVWGITGERGPRAPLEGLHHADRDQLVRERLRETIREVCFDDFELKDVVQFFRDVSGVNIYVRWFALNAAGITKATTVKFQLNEVSFDKALRVTLEDVGAAEPLAYIVDDGVITISTKDDLESLVDRAWKAREVPPEPSPTASGVSSNKGLILRYLSFVVSASSRDLWEVLCYKDGYDRSTFHQAIEELAKDEYVQVDGETSSPNAVITLIQAHPLAHEADALGLRSIRREQLNTQPQSDVRAKGRRPTGILDMLKEAHQEVWLFHLSGGDRVRSNIGQIAEWLFPPSPPAEARQLKVMALDPKDGIVGYVAKLVGRDEVIYQGEIVSVLDELARSLAEAKASADRRSPGRYNCSWQFRVYRAAPACSIVAADPFGSDPHLLLEFYGYHFGFADRLCAELSKSSQDSLLDDYVEGFAGLWGSSSDSRDYPHGKYAD